MVGETLKQARLSQGINLEKVASDLKIRRTQLEALEEDNWDIFPADVYIIGYIRAYSLYLGLKPEPLIEEFKKSRQSEALSEAPVESRKKEIFFIKPGVIITAVIIISGIAVISSVLRQDRNPSHVLPSQPGPSTPSVAITPAEDRIIRENPKPSQPVAKPQESVKTDTSFAGQKEEKGEFQLRIIATELTWLSVETEEGSHDITMRPGDTVQYVSKKGFKLKIGNAGGIKLVLNGKDLGSPGRSGEVKVISLPD